MKPLISLPFCGCQQSDYSSSANSKDTQVCIMHVPRSGFCGLDTSQLARTVYHFGKLVTSYVPCINGLLYRTVLKGGNSNTILDQDLPVTYRYHKDRTYSLTGPNPLSLLATHNMGFNDYSKSRPNVLKWGSELGVIDRTRYMEPASSMANCAFCCPCSSKTSRRWARSRHHQYRAHQKVVR